VNTVETGINERFEEGMFGNWKLRTDYENMNKELTSASCVVHTVYSTAGASGVNEDIEADYAVKDSGLLDGQLSGMAPLHWMSEASGGRHFENIRKYDSIMEEIQSFTGSYYVLGYYISEKWDGRFHKLKVKVKRKGCDVFAQEGYYNPKPFSEYSALEKKWHFLELALIENPKFQTPLRISSNALSSEINGMPVLFMISKIPREKLEEISGDRVEIVNLIFNEQNDVVSLKRVNANIADLQNEDIYSYCLFYLPPGHYRSRAIIRNLDTGKAAVATSDVLIPDKFVQGVRLYPPLLLVPEKNALYINTRSNRTEKGELEFSGLLSLYPFDVSRYSPLVGELERGNSKLLVLMRGAVLDVPDGIVKFYTRLVYEPTREEIPAIVTCQKTGGVFTFTVPTVNLLPGRYYLYLFTEEKDTQAKASVNATFVVRQ